LSELRKLLRTLKESIGDVARWVEAFDDLSVGKNWDGEWSEVGIMERLAFRSHDKSHAVARHRKCSTYRFSMRPHRLEIKLTRAAHRLIFFLPPSPLLNLAVPTPSDRRLHSGIEPCSKRLAGHLNLRAVPKQNSGLFGASISSTSQQSCGPRPTT
jgi:hypothetical protein